MLSEFLGFKFPLTSPTQEAWSRVTAEEVTTEESICHVCPHGQHAALLPLQLNLTTTPTTPPTQRHEHEGLTARFEHRTITIKYLNLLSKPLLVKCLC